MNWMEEAKERVQLLKEIERIPSQKDGFLRNIVDSMEKLIAAVMLAEAKLMQIHLLSNEEKTRIRAGITASRLRSGDVEEKS